MTANDAYKDWVAKNETSVRDTITPRLEDRFSATFGPHVADVEGVAAGLHWCLAPPAVSASELGPDGHPANKGLVPPLSQPRRMWAGSDLEFFDPLRSNDTVEKSSRILLVEPKQGRSGDLYFVTVEHRYSTERGLAIQETQKIVYRGASPVQSRPAPVEDPSEAFGTEWQVDVNSVMLFRYSALTFNSHRIHYDSDYAKNVEQYDGLVIHGPLQATLLLNLAVTLRKGLPRRFFCRGVAPALGSQTLTVGATASTSESKFKAISESGVTTMTALAEW